MKIAILSDTHDNTAALVWIIKYLNDQNVTTLLHAGDLISPGIVIRIREHYQGQMHFVFGNNDGEQALLERKAQESDNITCHLHEMRLELGGRSIFMSHYSSISELVAKSGEFDIAIGGHDHIYRVLKHGESLFINPGNTVTKDEWLFYKPDKESSFVILDLDSLEHERVLLPAQV